MSHANTTKIMLVEDHPIVRLGFVQLIGQAPDLEVCAEVEDANGALAAARQDPPDLVLVDLGLKRSSGLELIKILQTEWPRLPVLVVSMEDESLYAQRALSAGARGYVMKREAPDQLLTAIRRVLSGGIYVSDAVASKLLNVLARGKGSQDGSPLGSLSDRELEVFQFVGQGLTTRNIAEALHLSVKTIETHRAHIMDKLGLANANELVRFAAHYERQLDE
jgi:DNA-binding NarL/FixJ family response regulator